MNDEAHNKPRGRATRVAAAGALMLSLTAIPVVANAQTPDTPPTPTTAPAAGDAATTDAVETSPAPEGVADPIDCDLVFENLDAEFGDLAELTDEERDQILAEEQAVADALDAAGVDYDWSEAEDGLRWVEIDWDDDAAVEALEDHWSEAFDLEDIDSEAIEIDDLGDYELTDEEIADINAEVDEMVAALEAAGVAVNVTSTEDGFKDIEIVDDSDETNDKVDAVFEELWGDEGDLEILEGDFDVDEVFDAEFEACFDEGDFAFDLTPEDIGEINADSEELIEALEAAGVPVTSTTDEDGVIEFEIDSEDASVLDAADEVFDDFYGCGEADFDIEEGELVEGDAAEVATP
jgi:hypothetical protein